jgi:hypothetical protein
VKSVWFKWNTIDDVESHCFYFVRLLHIRQVNMEVENAQGLSLGYGIIAQYGIYE